MKTYCIIHCRVSSAKQSQQGESLPVQERTCLDIAERNGWTLAHQPWLEAFSGRKNLRPIFEDILAFLDANPGVVRYYICRSIDRFTRGGSYAYEHMKRELATRGVAMVDSHGVIQATRNSLDDVGFEYDWSRYSPSEITETVLANTAKNEITTILTRMIGQEIRLTQRGYKIRGPQDGYRNAKVYVEGKRRTIQEPDPDRADFYRMMFTMRAAGQHTDQQIADHLNALGFRTRKRHHWDRTHQEIIGERGSIPLSATRLQEIIRRPIYCGVVWEKWTNWKPIQAPYPGLVSMQIWNDANRSKRCLIETKDGLELLENPSPTTGKRQTSVNPLFPFKNVIMCPRCGKPFWGSESRSRNGQRFPYYHCAREHARIGIPQAKFDKAVKTYLRRLRFSSGAANRIRTHIINAYRENQGEALSAASKIGHNVADLEAEKAATVKAFKASESETMRRELERDIERLDLQIENGQSIRNVLEITEHHIEAYIAEVKSILEHPAILIENPANKGQQEHVYRLVFEYPPTIDEITSGTAKLSLIFKLLRASRKEKNGLVRLQEITWNHIEPIILAWLENR